MAYKEAKMKDKNILYWIWLALRCGAESKEFGKLAAKYDDPFELYRLEEDETEHIENISASMKAKLCDKSLDRSYSILKYCKENKVDIITYADPRYPERLRRIETPPVLLYCLGSFPDFNNRLCLGMVGTRRMSEYGKHSAYKISYELAAARVVIVSGMAKGIDGVSSCGALEAGGDTVAVLGCGISTAYPKEHKRLMKAIASGGAVITEYPPDEPPNGYNFPRRNRIISGLCQGVLVIEGDMRSGSLITAEKAIDQGRDVFALPGKINEVNSEGPNDLIKNGAHVFLSSDDILNFYDFLYHDSISYRGHSKAKRRSDGADKAIVKYGVVDSCYKGQDVPSDKDGDISHPSNSARDKAANESLPKADPALEIRQADGSERILAGLDENSRKVFESMPIDKAVSADDLGDTGLMAGDIIMAFTLLELNGLISALPGGLYIRK